MNKQDDEIGYFGMARWNVGEGKSETLYVVTPLPARYGDVKAVCEARNKQELEDDPTSDYRFGITRLSPSEIEKYKRDHDKT
ncbi:hypothetical protein [Taklimakanibacter lacteus]|uniref:hypothetical protein n=1 Tax=Taklimakanibacter lacteus TaxID=2268456 RepID=UPI000E66D88B